MLRRHQTDMLQLQIKAARPVSGNSLPGNEKNAGTRPAFSY
jgi:hypothetical protein